MIMKYDPLTTIIPPNNSRAVHGTVIPLGNWSSLYSTKLTISACAGPGSMHKIFPVLVVLYTYLFKLYTYRQRAH